MPKNMGGGKPKLGDSNPKIGKVGVTEGMGSESGTFPFLPGASSYDGQVGSKSSKAHESGTTTKTDVPFLPNKPE
jgi:hypothetical protein